MAIMTASAGEQLERDLNKTRKALIMARLRLGAVVSYVEAERDERAARVHAAGIGTLDTPVQA